MRPKTFPATTYSGNSRQRLQEIREGLKQPTKSSSQGLPVGPGGEASLDPKILGKDAARQQQMRTTAKFGPYQKALREIRYSLLPFANESGTTSAPVEVNRQMLQELVNAGCDQVSEFQNRLAACVQLVMFKMLTSTYAAAESVVPL